MASVLRSLLALLILVAPLVSAARCARCCFGSWGIGEVAAVDAPAVPSRSNCCAKAGEGARSAELDDSMARLTSAPEPAPEGSACDCGTLDVAKERRASQDIEPGSAVVRPTGFAWHLVKTEGIRKESVNVRAPRAPVIVAMRC